MAAPAIGTVIRVGTYNVHGFVGRDGRRNVERVAGVIRSLGCRAIGLQEVDSRGAATTLAELEELTGMRAVAGATITEADGEYGNALLTDLEVAGVVRHDLSVPGREPRGALEVTLDVDNGSTMAMIVTHLGLRRSERRHQTERLLRIAEPAGADRPIVVIGDFNEWWPWSRSLRELGRVLDDHRAVPTFPANRPLFALDRIWLRPGSMMRHLTSWTTAEARLASDHLPLTADLVFPARIV
jgi:endonuclease/exonuclease/phosphatase family metal-dependent hydrolase